MVTEKREGGAPRGPEEDAEARVVLLSFGAGVGSQASGGRCQDTEVGWQGKGLQDHC